MLRLHTRLTMFSFGKPPVFKAVHIRAGGPTREKYILYRNALMAFAYLRVLNCRPPTPIIKKLQ